MAYADGFVLPLPKKKSGCLPPSLAENCRDLRYRMNRARKRNPCE